MSATGGYPAGAAYDPRAPWNQTDPRTETCPDCGGTGVAYLEIQEPCERCGGTGEIEAAEPDEFDEMAAEERYYEEKYGRN